MGIGVLFLLAAVAAGVVLTAAAYRLLRGPAVTFGQLARGSALLTALAFIACGAVLLVEMYGIAAPEQLHLLGYLVVLPSVCGCIPLGGFLTILFVILALTQKRSLQSEGRAGPGDITGRRV